MQQNAALTQIVQTLRRFHRSPFEPLPTFFVDLHSKRPKTSVKAVLRELRRHRLKVALPSTLGIDETVTRVLGLDNYSHSLEDPTSLYLNAEERRRYGTQGLLSATFNLAPTHQTFTDFAFRDKIFGEAFLFHSDGCDWTVLLLLLPRLDE